MFKALLKYLLALLLRPLQWADDYQRDRYIAKKAKKKIDPWSYWSDDKRAQVWASNMLILKQYGCAVLGAAGSIITWESIGFLGVLRWHTASDYLPLQLLLGLVAIIYCLYVIAIVAAVGSASLKLIFCSGFRWQVRWMMRNLPDDFDFDKLDESDKNRLHTLLQWEGLFSARRRTNKLLLDSLIQSYPREDENVLEDELVSQSS